MRGRGTAPGPRNGGYVPITFTFDTLNLADNTLAAAIQVPFACRAEAFTWHVDTTPTATNVLTLAKSATSVIGGTNLLSATIDLAAVPEGLARPAGTTPTLSTVAGVRDIATAQFVTLEIDGGGTGDMTRFACSLWVYVLDHANTDPAND
jgi:hypothetical protein